MDIEKVKQRAREYVELEADTKVKGIEYEQTFELFGKEDVAFSVKTTDEEFPEWWVIGGSTPINLYPKSKYDSVDETFSLHTGLMMRLKDRQFRADKNKPKEIGKDAFISHASEDKNGFVEPLAKQLDVLGVDIWYDGFELSVGDSLRKSIDRGLVNSRYGIVVLSEAFFDKNWTEYELNSLVTIENDLGEKVILPIWLEVTKADVMKYSPSLADRVALKSTELSIKEIAEKLNKEIATEY